MAQPTQSVQPMPPDPAVWYRTHWLTALAKGISTSVFIGMLFVMRFFEEVTAVEPVFRVLLFLSILIVVMIIIVGLYWLRWWKFTYNISADGVRVDQGVLMRNRRHMRSDRIQAVNVTQPLLARIFGLSRLDIQSAESGAGTIQLEYLKYEEAMRLRAQILHLASGAEDPADEVSADPAQPMQPAHIPAPGQMMQPGQLDPDDVKMLSIPSSRLVWLGLLSAGMSMVWIAPFVILLFVLKATAGSVGNFIFTAVFPILLVAMIPMLFSQAIKVVAYFRFTVWHTNSGLRLRYGLLETKTVTIPPGRVQAIEISQPLIWRATKWYEVKVTVAGGGDITDVASTSLVLPAGSFDDVLRVLAVIAPNPGTDRARELITRGVRGKGADEWFTVSPKNMIFLDPLAYRRNGFATTKTLLLMRSGRLTRRLSVMEHARIQSATISQGPLQRAFGVSTMVIHIPPGPVNTTIPHQIASTTRKLFDHEAAIAAQARRMTDRNEWMSAQEQRSLEKEARSAQATLEQVGAAPSTSRPSAVPRMPSEPPMPGDQA